MGAALWIADEATVPFMYTAEHRLSKNLYDPYVNLLRNTTQAFSGVVGGLHSLEVSPLDQPIRKSDEFSRRIARNIQVMLQTELNRQPVDPVGGSW